MDTPDDPKRDQDLPPANKPRSRVSTFSPFIASSTTSIASLATGIGVGSAFGGSVGLMVGGVIFVAGTASGIISAHRRWVSAQKAEFVDDDPDPSKKDQGEAD